MTGAGPADQASAGPAPHRGGYLPGMSTRRTMSARLTTRDDPAGANGLWGPTTAEERLDLLAEACALGWALTGRALPNYLRAEMPVRLVRRRRVVGSTG